MGPGGAGLPRPVDPPGDLRFTLRGIVADWITTSKGWWIFKETYAGIVVLLNREQLELCRERYGDVRFLDGQSSSIPSTVRIFMSPERQSEFPVDSEVGVTFAKSGPLQQFMQGTAPIAIVNVSPTGAGELENEILPVQLSLA